MALCTDIIDDEYCDDDDTNDDVYDDLFKDAKVATAGLCLALCTLYPNMQLFAVGRTSEQPWQKIARWSWAP